MRRKLEQTAAALSLLGGAYLFTEALETGVENYGVQYDRIITPQVDQTQIEKLHADSEQLTRTSIAYLAGSFALPGASGWMALKLNDETVARKQTEFIQELQIFTEETGQDTEHLFNENRIIKNWISEYDLATREDIKTTKLTAEL